MFDIFASLIKTIIISRVEVSYIFKESEPDTESKQKLIPFRFHSLQVTWMWYKVWHNIFQR